MEEQGGTEQAPYEQLRSLSAHASDGDVWRCEPLRCAPTAFCAMLIAVRRWCTCEQAHGWDSGTVQDCGH
eukprot:810295-Prymnesium_polylepis.1